MVVGLVRRRPTAETNERDLVTQLIGGCRDLADGAAGQGLTELGEFGKTTPATRRGFFMRESRSTAYWASAEYTLLSTAYHVRGY